LGVAFEPPLEAPNGVAAFLFLFFNCLILRYYM
jgi:hypothetical protein